MVIHFLERESRAHSCWGSHHVSEINTHTHKNDSHTQVFTDIVQVTHFMVRLTPVKEKDTPDVSTFSFGATTESQKTKVCVI